MATGLPDGESEREIDEKREVGACRLRGDGQPDFVADPIRLASPAIGRRFD
jgi:hypothetical protein